MVTSRSASICLFAVCFPFVGLFAVAAHAAEKRPARKATGIEKRQLWTTSRIHGTPEPPDPYVTEVAFKRLKFNEPLAMCVVPGTNRLAVAERQGKILTFKNDPSVSAAQLLVDAGPTVNGMTFHPNFDENGYFYLTEVRPGEGEEPNTVSVVRYQADVETDKRDEPFADRKTKKTIISWKALGHRGGCLKFGPDGYLYIGVGDGSGIADQLQTGQDVSDLLASILRIDVDRTSDGKAYSIPADNPFVNLKGARGEIWAYGLRQAWQFSFDTASGDLWAGDVGQDLWEMVYRIEKGGNYGWSVKEGNHPFRPERKPGPTRIVPPVVEHSHADFRSVTGGFVYHGRRLEELRGAYVYGDYDTGRIWSLRYRNGKVSEHRQLTDTQLRVVAFGRDATGEVYLVDFIGGKLHQLAPAPKPTELPRPFPQKLSETGLFASTKTYQPQKGLIPYSVNAALWSDGAVKDRFIALPGDSQIEFDTVTYPQPAPGALPGWRFPHDAVLVKTFSLEMEQGNPESLRRLETRILHHKYMPGSDEVGAQYWRGYTYVWNDDQTDAVLLGPDGLDREFTVRDAAAPGGERKQTWHFPSRAECTLCHTMSSKYALGVNTMQMNKDHDYGGIVANQLSTLDHLKVFKESLQAPVRELRRLADYHDKGQSLDSRARAYLHANCAHCHRKWGGGNADFQLLAALPVEETGTIGTRPGQGLFDLRDPRILVPGEPDRSMVYHRMKLVGLGRMPHIASSMVDKEAVELIRKWIKQMPKQGASE